MPSLNIKAKFSLLLGLIILGALLLLGIVMTRLSAFEARFSSFHEAGVEIQRQTLMVSRDVNYVSRLSRSIMLGDDFDKNLAGLDKTIASIEKSFSDMAKATKAIDHPDTQTRLSSEIDHARSDTMAFVNDARERMRTLQSVERTPETLQTAWKNYHKAATPLANAARESFQKLSETANHYLDETRASTQLSLDTLKTWLPIMQLGGLAVIVAFALYLLRSIIKPLQHAIGVADRVASGDLSQPIVAESNDEAGQMLQSLADMQERLRDVIRRVHELAAGVSTTSAKLLRAVQAVNDGASTQYDATAQMAATMEEMAVGIDHMASGANSSMQSARGSRQTAEEGRSVVEQAVEDIRQIAESVHQSSAVIETLSQRSGQISQIVNVIKDIADQTNLLALNAAIEAARAGEQGRGFAVVADEVRKLAERTTQSTQQISGMLSGVQDATGQVVTRMADSLNRVTRGAAQAESAQAHMSRIGEDATQMVAIIGDIASALDEQTGASNLIARQVENIAQMTERTTAEISDINQAVASLDNIVGSLGQAIHTFKI